MRGPTILALARALRDSPATRDVQIYPGWPGDRHISPRMVWVGFDIEGDTDIPIANAGPKAYDDIFRFPLEIRVAGSPDLDSALADTDRIMGAILEVLRTDPFLGDLDALVSAQVSLMRGPYAEGLPDGPVGFGEVEVTAHLRIS